MWELGHGLAECWLCLKPLRLYEGHGLTLWESTYKLRKQTHADKPFGASQEHPYNGGFLVAVVYTYFYKKIIKFYFILFLYIKCLNHCRGDGTSPS